MTSCPVGLHPWTRPLCPYIAAIRYFAIKTVLLHTLPHEKLNGGNENLCTHCLPLCRFPQSLLFALESHSIDSSVLAIEITLGTPS